MEPTLSTALHLVAAWGLLAFLYRRFSNNAMDPVALFCYGFIWFYLYRATLVVIGADPPYPEYLFSRGTIPAIAEKELQGLILFLAAFGTSFVLWTPAAPIFARFAPVVPGDTSFRKLTNAAMTLTVISVLIGIGLVARFGGVSEVIYAAKFEKILAGTFVLTIVPTTAAITSIALFVELTRNRSRGGFGRPALVAFASIGGLLNASLVFLWGSRSIVAVVILLMFAAKRHFAPESKTSYGLWRPLVVAIPVLVIAIVVFSAYRQQVASPGYAGETTSLVTNVSIAMNAMSWDASLLAIRDWPETYTFNDGHDFVRGVSGLIPRVLWENKPEQVLPGAWFRQIYQPWTRNGWLPESVGNWYLNFGFVGIFAGGALSGMLYATLMKAWPVASRDPFSYVGLSATILLSAAAGIDVDTLLNWAGIGLPLLLLGVYLSTPLVTRDRGYSASRGAVARLPYASPTAHDAQ